MEPTIAIKSYPLEDALEMEMIVKLMSVSDTSSFTHMSDLQQWAKKVVVKLNG